MKRLAASPLLALLLAVPLFDSRAQPVIPVITDARVVGDTFRIEFTGSSSPPCVVQAADNFSGPWMDLPTPGQGSPALVLIDRPQRFFRIRWDVIYSANAAGYVHHAQEVKLIACPFLQGNNTVAELFRGQVLPQGAAVYKFDGSIQRYSGITQFLFDSWSHPDETLAPGEGAVFNSRQKITLGGIVPGPPANFPTLKGGWNLVSFPSPIANTLPPTNDGDLVIRWDRQAGYLTYTYSGGWMPEAPPIRVGEAFWYFRNSPNPDAMPPEASLYFNNFAVFGDSAVNAPSYDLVGCPFEGTNFIGQLWASPAGSNGVSLQPVGAPLPFRTGVNAGYLDTRGDAIRHLLFITPGSNALIEIRVWDRRKGTTWNEALANNGYQGKSEAFETTTGGGSVPPPPPAILTGLRSFSGVASLISSLTARPTVFANDTASFKVSTLYSGPKPVTYQWQKSADKTNWMNLAGGGTTELRINSTTTNDNGWYRVFVDVGCSSQFSNPLSLTVLPPPTFIELRYILPPNGGFMFTLKAEPAHGYRVDRSEDLTNWVTLATLDNFDGEELIADFGAPGFNHRFYRVTPTAP